MFETLWDIAVGLGLLAAAVALFALMLWWRGLIPVHHRWGEESRLQTLFGKRRRKKRKSAL